MSVVQTADFDEDLYTFRRDLDATFLQELTAEYDEGEVFVWAELMDSSWVDISKNSHLVVESVAPESIQLRSNWKKRVMWLINPRER